MEGGMPKRVGGQIREWKLSVLKSGAHLSSESLESWLVFWILERGLRCALIRCTLGPGKSKKGWDFGGEGT